MANKRGNPGIQAVGLETRFKPGESGNPSGKMKDSVEITPAVKRYLVEHPEAIEKIVASWVQRAQEETPSLGQLLERTEGKVVDKREVSGTIQIKVVYGDGQDKPGE